MRVVVIGGTGTIGSAVVRALSERHEVVPCGRSSGDVTVDITSTDSIRKLFERVGSVDAVVCAAGEAQFKPLAELTEEDYEFGLRYKVMGQVNVVRIGHEHVNDRGSLTLTSGVTARQPLPGATAYGIANAALEGFARAAALDLPRGIRINAVSPQWVVDTLVRYGMDPAWGVSAEQVALGYVESVDGAMTGAVIDAGWRYDWASSSMSVAAAVG